MTRARRKPAEAAKFVASLPPHKQGVTPSPLVTELRMKGYAIDSVADLYNQRMDYRDAIPILLKWLPRVDDVDVKEGIVRALTVRWAKPQAAPALIREFRQSCDKNWFGLRWAIANALSVVSDDSVFEDIVELFRDRSYGRAREMLALALANIRDPKAADVLIAALDDDDIKGHALIALGKLRAKNAVPLIEPFTKDPKAWIRREARKALERIGSSAAS